MPSNMLGQFWTFVLARKVQLLLLIAASCLAVFAGVRWTRYAQGHTELHISLGPGGQRNTQLKSVLTRECARAGLPIVIESVAGSEAALQRVVDGELDVAVVRGFVGRNEPAIHQVCTGVCEVLHLFVRGDVNTSDSAVNAVRGKRVFLGRAGSETRALAELVLEYMGLQAGVDFEEVHDDVSRFAALPTAELPDAVFEVASLPSSIGEELSQKFGYRLVGLPFGPAMRLRERTLEEVVVPPYTYDAEPGVPATPLTTIGCRTVIVASSRLPAVTVTSLLSVLFESDFARHAGLPQWDASLLSNRLEYPLHAGTTAYLRKDRPLIRADVLEQFEGVRDALASTGCALLLFWGWYRRRKVPRLEGYLLKLAEIELDALRNHRLGHLSPYDLQQLRERLWLLKREMLEHYTTHRGKMESDLVQALARVRDVDSSLTKLSRPADDARPLALAHHLAA